MEKLYRMIRKYQVVEEVETYATSEANAILLAEDDEDQVKVLSINDGDYEVDYTTVQEIKK